jgi:hypothetical protein
MIPVHRVKLLPSALPVLSRRVDPHPLPGDSNSTAPPTARPVGRSVDAPPIELNINDAETTNQETSSFRSRDRPVEIRNKNENCQPEPDIATGRAGPLSSPGYKLSIGSVRFNVPIPVRSRSPGR